MLNFMLCIYLKVYIKLPDLIAVKPTVKFAQFISGVTFVEENCVCLEETLE